MLGYARTERQSKTASVVAALTQPTGIVALGPQQKVTFCPLVGKVQAWREPKPEGSTGSALGRRAREVKPLVGRKAIHVL